MEINAMSMAMITANYLPVPVIGYLGDKYGEKNLALLGGLFLIPGYFSAAYFVNGMANDYRLMMASFAAVGGGLASFFFAGLVSCAKLYPQSAGLSISAPIASFGISSLWEAQAIKRWFSNPDGSIKLKAVYTFFGVVYIVTTTTCYLGARLADVYSRRGSKEQEEQQDANNEDIDDDAEFGGLTQRERLVKVLRSPDMWIFLVCFLISSGPLEMYINNMGAIIDTIPRGPDVSSHVSLFAAASTTARLLMGGLSDAVRHRVSRPIQLAAVMSSVGVAHFLLASGIFASNRGSIFYISSIVNGFAYGVTFTLVPTIIACVWGVKSFGTNWGMFLLAPAAGVNIYGYIFAQLYEQAAKSTIFSPLVRADRDFLIKRGSCDKSYLCYQSTFTITGTGFILCALLIVGLWHRIWKFKGRNL
ncbi:hypothetical protein TRICI_000850 [Trichomonascus ciferrii]|uniref:Probable transporter MCH1 n=1 Tax=Trichomonascus ciferrii TaxID=44093 RepID=A0A642VA49_9ASCO|nr:hypothetical protein TRICI_000850 [Trichomonascus ciferrii]